MCGSTTEQVVLQADPRLGPYKVGTTHSMLRQGAPEIQAFCMGHTAFVSSAAFFDCAAGLRLLSGSGDGTVRYGMFPA